MYQNIFPLILNFNFDDNIFFRQFSTILHIVSRAYFLYLETIRPFFVILATIESHEIQVFHMKEAPLSLLDISSRTWKERVSEKMFDNTRQ